MASPVNAILCALVATAFWTVPGYAVARHVLPRVLAIGAAPVIGWAVFSAATLPVLTLIGFSAPAVIAMAVAFMVIGAAGLFACPAGIDPGPGPAVPLWSYVAAATLALVPASALVPKYSAAGVHLADPMFDHSKIAIIDAMTRQGLPPVNPVFAESGAGRLAYYYLWHFSAAELALPLRISGWEADIGLTWFTAFASLALMTAIAVWLGKNSGAAILTVVIAAGASLRDALSYLFGSTELEPFLTRPNGFAGWLFQAAWVPQHLMSASCTLVAMLLMVQLSQRQGAAGLLTLALVAAAGFESSAYVGGVTFAVAAVVAAPLLLAAVESDRRIRVAASLAAAAVLAVVLAAPFIRDQIANVAARGGGSPLGIHHFAVLGEMFAPALRRELDVPAYWLVLLPIEFPATYVAGTIGLALLLRGAASGPEKTTTAVLAALAAAGLCLSWLAVSKVANNNDLGLRAVLPAAMVLIVATAAVVTLAPRRTAVAAIALGGLILGLPGSVGLARYYGYGTPAADAAVFAAAPELWTAVRRHAAPTARVANNPSFLQDLTPWPANISWALLADRSSCFAGRELAIAFAPLPPERRAAVDAEFARVFDGRGTPGDIDDMARKFGCDVAVVVPQDGAWTSDPFATSPDYREVEVRDGRWRIYLKVPPNPIAR